MGPAEVKSVNIGTPAPAADEFITVSFDDVTGPVLPAIGERVHLRDDDGHHVGTGRVMGINSAFKLVELMAAPDHLAAVKTRPQR